jgi:LPS sulfotransferase NodH
MFCAYLWCSSVSYVRSPTSDGSVEITRARPPSRLSAPRPFLVFTTQRSGSGWTMDLLGIQKRIGTPADGGKLHSESMLPTQRANAQHWKSFKWEAWRDVAERAFVNVSARNPAALAVGWKLMYDQVPAPLVEPFVEWVRNNSIRVVHLVREASLLQHLSSEEALRTKVYHTTLSGGNQTPGVPVQLDLEAGRHIHAPILALPITPWPVVDARTVLRRRKPPH